MATSRTKRPTSVQQDAHWYRLPVGAPVHDHVVGYGKALLVNESSFHSKNLARERMYRGVDLMGQRDALMVLERAERGIARLNAMKSICDTFSSRLSKDRPMPDIVTEDSDWEMKRRGRKFREFIVGQMADTEFDDLSRRALDDGTILGIGFTRIDDNNDTLFAERIPVNDLLFDRRECKYGKPRQAMRLQRVARDHLAELFPKHRDAIERAPGSTRRKDDSDIDGDGPKVGDLDDYVDTWEPWFIPPSQDSESGRHVLCIDGATLVSERWWEPRFPWAMFQLSDPPWGIYPDGFVDLLAMMQHRVNCIVRDIQLNLAATGRGFFMVNEANDIPVEMLSGMRPFKLKFNGAQPPTWNTPTPFNAAQIGSLDKFIGWMYDISGVSRAQAESKSTLGPGASGVALDTQYDIDSERFRKPQANYARYRLNSGQCYIDGSARIARRREMGKGVKRSWVATTWKGRDAIQKLDYNKVVLDEGSYRMRIEPMGFLPTERAGKLSVVEQLAKAGVIPQWLVPTLFDDPDLQEANRIMLSALRNCLRKMDELADEELDAPMPEMLNDLELELKIATAYYNWVQCEKAPEGVQQRYRDYIDDIKALVKTAKADAPMPDAGVNVPMAGAPPMAPPMLPGPGAMQPMPQGPVPAPQMIGAPPMPPGAMPMAA